MDAAFVNKGRTVQDTYLKIISQPNFDPGGFCFARHKNAPIGIACALKKYHRNTPVGYIDMAAVLPEYTGHKLGKWMSLFLLHYFEHQNIQRAMLDTDDFRRRAIKNYLNLGFVPAYVGANHAQRWQHIFEKLGMP